MFKTNYLKYPIYLFLAIFIAKFGYVVVESAYNYYVLITTTSPNLDKTIMEELNENGHLISSMGITLLFVPFFYLAVKKYNDSVVYTFLIITTFLTFIATYQLLNYTIDKIVESNKEKRYDAYYVNIFKYGILNNIFAYNSFIDSNKVANNSLDVNDRILLTNSFLLLYADKELIAKLKERGKNAVADVYISQYDKVNYDKSFQEFKQLATKVQEIWGSFNNARGSLDKNLKRLESEKTIKKHHQTMINTLKEKYKEYSNGAKNLQNEIAKATTQSKLNALKVDLDKYFEYEGYEEARQKYRVKMESKFGHFITPFSWLDNGYLTTKSIKKRITIEMQNEAKKRTKLPQNMSAKKFFKNMTVKNEVAKELKRDGILIPRNFDYSYRQFKKYYNIMSIKRYNEAPKKFYRKLYAKIGKNDLKLSDSWNRFMRSKFIYSKISQAMPNTSKKDIQILLRLLNQKI